MSSLRSGLAAFGVLLAVGLFGAAPAAAQPDEALTCAPDCRSGYVCISGACVSACNPPCGPGERCGADGECALSTVDPLTQPVQPAAQASTGDSAADATPQRVRPERMRFYVNAEVIPAGEESTSILGDYQGEDFSESFDLGVGASTGVELRFGRYFALALEPRLYWVVYDRPETFSGDFGVAYDVKRLSLELALAPTLRVPLGMLEFFVPLAVGFSYLPGSFDNDRGGMTFGIGAGAILWLHPSFGLQALLGYHGRVLSGTLYDVSRSYDTVTTAHALRIAFGPSFGF